MDHFEKQYKNAMDGYKPSVDTNSIWENIEPRLHPKKKRRLIAFWWFLLLIPGIAGIWMLINPGMGSKTSKLLTQNNGLVPDKNQELSIKTQSFPPSAIPIVPEVKQNARPFFQSNGSLNSEKQVGAIAGNLSLSSYKEDLNKYAFTKDTEPAIKETLLSNISPTTALQQLNAKALFASNTQTNLGKPNHSKSPKIKAHQPRWSSWIQAQAGLGLTLKTLDARPEIRDGGNSLSDRKQSEQMLESVSANVQWIIHHKRGFQTYLGLQYMVSNELYKVAYQTSDKRTNIEVVEQVVDANGRVIEEKFGPVTSTINTNYLKKTYNRYQFIDIPMGIGFAMPKGKHWWAYAGGLGLNIFMSMQGEQETGYGYTVQLSRGSTTYNNVYKNAVGWNAWMRLQYNWRFRPHTFLFANVQLQIPFSSITVPEYALRQTHWQIGTHVGVQVPLSLNPEKK